MSFPCNKVHGSWSPWAPWGECSHPCDWGKATRTRACNNPAPRSGGLSCPGQGTGEKACRKPVCRSEFSGLILILLLELVKEGHPPIVTNFSIFFYWVLFSVKCVYISEICQTFCYIHNLCYVFRGNVLALSPPTS